jgi:hypothetical protein
LKSTQAWDELNKLQELLEKHKMDKMESTNNFMAAKWTLVGDRCSKEFFEIHKGHRLCLVFNGLLHGGQTFIEKDDV